MQFQVVGKTRHQQFCSKPCINKGRTHTEEWKLEMSTRNSGSGNPFYGKNHSLETKLFLKNRIEGLTWEEQMGEERASLRKEKQSETYTGEGNPFYGKTHTVETKNKISESHRDCSGSNNPMFGQGEKLRGNKNGAWEGGISHDPYCGLFTENLKTKIRTRDRFTCRVCGKNGSHVHHIDYDKLNSVEDNLVTLCHSCHMKTNFGRENWTEFFRNE